MNASYTARAARCFTFLFLAAAGGCGRPPAAPPGDQIQEPPSDGAWRLEGEPPAAASPEQVAALQAAVARCGGTVTLHNGQPAAVDLAAGRATADAAAFALAVDCPALRSLRLRAGPIPGEQLARLARLERLEELLLQDAAIDDAALALAAERLRRLRRLTLRNAFRVTEAGLRQLAAKARLTHLALIEMRLSRPTLEALAGMETLTSLDLRMSTGVEADDLNVLARAPSLRELKLGGPEVDNPWLAAAAALPHLESLAIEDAAAGGGGLEQLASDRRAAERIVAVALARCPALDDAALAPLADLPNLRRLALRDLPVSGELLDRLPQLAQLERLALNDMVLQPDAFQAIARCRRLKRLELAGSVLPPGALELLASLADLEYLNLADCGVTDADLAPLSGLKRLKTLVIEGNPGVTPEAVDRLLPRGAAAR